MQNSNKNNKGKERVEKVCIKKKKGVTQLFVFGYKVGCNFHSFSSPYP